MSEPPSLGVLILGAGASSRMGQPKLLLPWARTTILGHLIVQWTKLGATQTAVVLALENSPLTPELDKLGFPAENRIYNPHPNQGMISSIQSAAAWPGWNPILTHCAIVLGDQPHLDPKSLQRLITFAGVHPSKICQPSYAGKPKHPVILPKFIFRAITLSRASTLKEFLAFHEPDRACIEIDDPGLDLDIDRPEDYEKALKS